MNPDDTIPHPRVHALTLAAAKHLTRMGHISPAKGDSIARDARKALAGHKKRKAPAPAFGALGGAASATHFMSTVNPTGYGLPSPAPSQGSEIEPG